MHYPKWIGCSNKNKENVWRWPDGKTLKDKGYSNWANSESKNYGNGEHYCEQYSSGSWNAAGPPKIFNAKKPYVCSHFTKQKEGFVGIREGFRVLSGAGQCPPGERIPDVATCRKAYEALRA